MISIANKKEYYQNLLDKDLGFNYSNKLTAFWINTKLGEMLAIADDKALYLLEFLTCKNIERKIKQLKVKTESIIVFGHNKIIELLENELQQFFKGLLKQFKTPVAYLGTDFQIKVWKELTKINHGETKSYAQLAIDLNMPSAFRAVANANGANKLAIIIPCHRVINKNGDLGGYGGGLSFKKELLSHEAKNL